MLGYFQPFYVCWCLKYWENFGCVDYGYFRNLFIKLPHINDQKAATSQKTRYQITSFSKDKYFLSLAANKVAGISSYKERFPTI